MIRWDLIILFFLVSCITAGITFLILGLEKNTNESEETRKTYKWVGVGLLIFGGVGMLFWLYFKYRNRSKINVISSDSEYIFSNRSKNKKRPVYIDGVQVGGPRSFF